MKTLLAIFFPCLYFVMEARLFPGIICLALQFTLIGWVPATLWALYDNSRKKPDDVAKKTDPTAYESEDMFEDNFEDDFEGDGERDEGSDHGEYDDDGGRDGGDSD